MKKQYLTSLLSLLLVLTYACSSQAGFSITGAGERLVGSGVSKTVDLPIHSYAAVAVHGIFNVEIETGKTAALQLTIDDNLLEHVDIKVENGILDIGMKSGNSYQFQSPLKVVTSTPVLSKVTTHGSTKVNVNDVKNQIMEVTVHGSSKLRVNGVSATNLTANVHGSSKLFLKGQTAMGDFKSHGSSKIDAQELATKDVIAKASGSAKIMVNPTVTLSAKASGASKVIYLGDPKITQQKTSGVGKIYKMLEEQ